MGEYINTGNEGFRSAVNGRYVDKTAMIAVINESLNTERRYTCVTRCRRFGKSLAAKMLCAYYDKSVDSRSLFINLAVSRQGNQFEQHLNKYPVIYLDITDFTTQYPSTSIVSRISQSLIKDLLSVYPSVSIREDEDLMTLLVKIYETYGEKFIMIIDEWDAICREYENDSVVIDEYLFLLRRLFKGGNSDRIFAGVYMTGILPIKKYNTQSALNNFREYSMTIPGVLDSFFGFTSDEVTQISKQSEVNVNDLKEWYDGYEIGKQKSIYNPYSVMEAISRGYCSSFWQSTSAYDAISSYISLNYEGLKDDIIYMLGGGRCDVDATTFDNATIKSKDDVLTMLIHFGYLSYDIEHQQCYIPNKEVSQEMEKAIKACDWVHLNAYLKESKMLLEDTLNMNEASVAWRLEKVHSQETSILAYNDENSLACVLSIAYYYAKKDYIVHREFATGKGFADIVLIPRKNVDLPAIVLELKYDKSADAAISQIHRKDYPSKVAEYVGDMLLVGINYDRRAPYGKRHTCKIEKIRL